MAMKKFAIALLLLLLLIYDHPFSGAVQPSADRLPSGENRDRMKIIAEDSDTVHTKNWNEYLEQRDRCTWQYRGKAYEDCALDVQFCIVHSSLEEGSGFFVFTRIGPVTTTGGTEDIMCGYAGYSPPSGAILTRSLHAVIDPYTGNIIPYPPIHLHHAVAHIFDNMTIPADYLVHMPWLAATERMTDRLGFGTGSADLQCLPRFGGTNCFARRYPKGYGQKVIKHRPTQMIKFHVQDVRVANSPPMSLFMENGQFYVTGHLNDTTSEQSPFAAAERMALREAAMSSMSSVVNNEEHDIRPAVDIVMGVGSPVPPYTYHLQYGMPSYQFVTYYFSMDVELPLVLLHSHSMHGDEMWMVSGNQDHVGIPPQHQRPVDAKLNFGGAQANVGAIGEPIALSSVEALHALKMKMEQSLIHAARQYHTARSHHSSHNASINNRRLDVGEEEKEGEGFRIKPYEAQEFVHNDYGSLPRKPGILCKFISVNENITERELLRQRHQYATEFNSVTGSRRPPVQPTETLPRGYDPIGAGGSKFSLEQASEALAAQNQHHASDHSQQSQQNIVLPQQFAQNQQLLQQWQQFQQWQRLQQQQQQQQQPPQLSQQQLAMQFQFLRGQGPHRMKRKLRRQLSSHQHNKNINPNLVAPAQHAVNRFIGILPGNYYRRTIPFRYVDGGYDRHAQECRSIHVKAGEYITMIHFNNPRIRPSSDQQYDGTVNTLTQHSFLCGLGHIVNFPYN